MTTRKSLIWSYSLVLLTAFSAQAWAANTGDADAKEMARDRQAAAAKKDLKLEKDVITSIYKACQGVVVVDRSKYEDHKKEWAEWEANCNQGKSVQVTLHAGDDRAPGVKFFDPLNEGVQYLDFTKSVVQKAMENLELNRKFAQCTAMCFKGDNGSCEETSDDGKKSQISCEDRRKSVLSSLAGSSVRARLELAMATDNKTGQVVAPGTILQYKDEDLLNYEMRGFGIAGVPNPFEGTKMLPREIERAKAKLAAERSEAERKANGASPKKTGDDGSVYRSVLSNQLIQNRDQHRMNYSRIVFEEVPLLAVLSKPNSFNDVGVPQWDNNQIAEAFTKLVENGEKTRKRLQADYDRGKLEFSRTFELEAERKWLWNALPGTTEEHELLHYMSLSGIVNQVLEKDKSKCGIATTLAERAGSKATQNMVMSFVVSGGLMGAAGKKTAGAAVAEVAEVASTLTGTAKVFATGLAMSSPYLFDAVKKPTTLFEEAATRSGTGGKQEGIALHTAEDIESAQEGRLVSGLFAIATPGIGGVAKTGSNLMERYLVGRALKGELKNAGVDDELTKRMVALAKSGDKNVSAAARVEAKNFIDLAKAKGGATVDPRIKDLAARLEKQGLTDEGVIARLADTAKFLEEQKDQGTLARIFDMVGKAGSSPAFASATPDQKRSIIEAAMSFGRLGYNKNDAEILKLLADKNWIKTQDALKGVSVVMDDAAALLKKSASGEKDPGKLAMLREQAVQDAYALKAYGKTASQLSEEAKTAETKLAQARTGGNAAAIRAAEEESQAAKSRVADTRGGCECTGMCQRGAAHAAVTPSFEIDPTLLAQSAGRYLACVDANKDVISQLSSDQH